MWYMDVIHCMKIIMELVIFIMLAEDVPLGSLLLVRPSCIMLAKITIGLLDKTLPGLLSIGWKVI